MCGGLSCSSYNRCVQCYSRSFRNGPLVAKAKGEEYSKEWYVHMKGPVSNVADGEAEADDIGDGDETENDATGLTASQEAMVVKAVEDARKDFWAAVAEKLSGKMGVKVLTADEVKEAYDQIVGEET